MGSVAPLAVLAPLVGFCLLGGGETARARATDAEIGTLPLRAQVFVDYGTAIACPAGLSSQFECFVRTGKVVVPGLGPADEAYAYVLENAPPGCTAAPGSDAIRLPATTVRLTVAGKGAIDLRTGGTGCLSRSGSLRSSEPFTIVGGSGSYAGASGGGTLTSLSVGPPSFTGFDTWTGTLVVPGLRFDTTAPTIAGAGSKTVVAPRRAKTVRVSYAVTGQDDVDGVVPVTCSPRSGSSFAIGRTRVKCSATDTSGNTGAAAFVVKVVRKR